jgi:enoyl-CoA hydratase
MPVRILLILNSSNVLKSIKMDLTEIKLHQEDGIAWITLNRPAKLNALTPTMMEEWRKVLISLEGDKSCRVIVIDGEGKSWSAGVDLAVFQTSKIESGNQMYDDGMEIMRLLENMPQVTIAMVNGYCFTGALEMMLAFDMAICADEAKIGDTHAKWGILPKWGLTQRLQNQVGLRKAKQMSFTTQTVLGKEAEKIGLVNESVPLSELKERTLEIAQQIIGNSRQTIASIKTLYQFGSMHTMKEGLDFETAYQAELTDKTDNLKNFKKEI